MKLHLPIALAAILGCATATAKTYVAQVIHVVDEGKTSDSTMLLKFSNNNGIWPGSTNESPKAWVKDGLGTATVTGDLTLYQPLIVREGTMIIQGCTIKNYNNFGNGVSNIMVGGNNAHLTLDNATYKQDLDYNQNYTTSIAIGNADGAGTVTLQNNSLLHTDHFIFAGYESTASGHVGGTTVNQNDSTPYSGGTAGRSTINILSGSTLSAGTCLQFGDVDVFIDGEGSQLIDLNRDSSPAGPNYSYFGTRNDSTTTITLTNGGDLNMQQYLLTGYGANSSTAIKADGEGSEINVKYDAYIGYYETGSSDSIELTNGAKANFEGSADLGYGADATISTDAASSVKGTYFLLNSKCTIKNAGTFQGDTIDVDGATIDNSGTLTGGNLTINSGTVTSTGEIKLSDTLTLNGGKLSLTVSSANLKRAYVSAAALQTGEAPAIELVATENLKAGKYHILSVGETPESEGGEEQPSAVTSTSGEGASGEGESTSVSNPIQYTMIGVDGMTTTWEGGDLYLTLENQLMIWRDSLSDALQAANWGVFHSSQAFTGTLWAQRPAATCIIVDEGTLLTAWGSAYSSFISQSGDSKFNGADYSIYGASMGVEAPLSKHRIVGAAFGYDIGKVSPGTTTDVDQTTVHVAAYGRAAVWCLGNQSNIALDWSVAYGRTTSEHDAIPGDWTQNSFQIDARATYSRSINSRTAVSAFVGAQYFTQEDASNARADVDGITNLRVMLGTGIHRSVTDRTTVFGEAALRHDVVRDNPHVMLDGFDYGTGANPGRFGGSISAGVEHRLNDDWKIRANYSYEVADDQNEHSFGAGASYSF